MSSSVPPYDLTRLSSLYPDGAQLRVAYLNLARWSKAAERWEDLARIMREVVRAATAGQLGPTPIPNQAILMKVSGLDGPPTNLTHPSSASFFSTFTSSNSNSNSSNAPGTIVVDPHDISAEERFLLFTSYKQIITSLRQSWRAIHAHLETSSNEISAKDSKLIDEYKNQLEREILMVCTDITNLLEQTLIAVVTVAEAKVYYLKMAADFYRYLAEIKLGITGLIPIHLLPPLLSPTSSASSSATTILNSTTTSPTSLHTGTPISSIIPSGYDKKASEYYAAAHKIAVSSLDPTHPSRLGLCLNYSVLLYEIFRDRRQACELARQTFDAAITRLDEVEEQNYKESTLMMQLLRDNLTLWTSHEQEQ